VKLEIVVAPDAVEATIDTLVQAAASGKIGDGKIWVTEVESIVRIRTGETGPDAI
jgi:nitrogen regulatory protein PII